MAEYNSIFFCCFNESWQKGIIEQLLRRFKPSKIASLSTLNHKVEQYDGEYTWVDCSCFYFLNYKEYETKRLLPIDEELLKGMKKYESLYYSMLDRSEILLSKKLSYSERKEKYLLTLRILRNILIEEHTDLCVFSDVPHVGFDMLLYGLCKYLNITVVMEGTGLVVPGETITIYATNDYENPIPALEHKNWVGASYEYTQLGGGIY